MNKEKLLSIINKYVGYAEQEIYDAVAEYEEEKISFAKKHCEAALKAASENAKIKYIENRDVSNVRSKKLDIEYLSETSSTISLKINTDSILNAYPLTNIK